MPSRATWKGQLRLSLVSIPVEMYSASKSGARISFRQIHEPTGKPVRYEKVVAGVGPIDAADIMKGYEYEKGKYVLLDPEEIESIRLESKRTFELVQFVDACEIPPLYFDKPYYLVPTDELAEDAYRVVRDALRKTAKVGLGQITLRGQEHIAVVKPCGDGLLLETLHYADEIVGASRLFASIEDEEVDSELLDVATALIERKTAPFDAKAFTDNYSEAMREMLDAKLRNKKVKRVSTDEDELPRPTGENVVDLMAALKKSLEKSGSGTTGKKAAGAAASESPRRGKSKTASTTRTAKTATTKSGSRKKVS